MDDVPQTEEDYGPEDLRQVKAGCLEVTTRLGDLLDDLVIVGGLVPALLVDLAQEEGPGGADPLSRHVGTQDLDLGFAIGLVDEGRYAEVSTRLARCGFAPDENEQGNLTPQRWRHEGTSGLTIDFLISPTKEEEGGSIKHLEENLAAIVVTGLELAFEDTCEVELSGTRLDGAEATRKIPVCGAGGVCASEGACLPAAGKR
jgi:hypothetical protein